jgi:hypothetical protein
MSIDVIALVPRPPDIPAVLAGMAAAGEELLVLEAAGGAAIQLCDAPGGETVRALLTVEEPILVPIPGEVGRLLGDEVGSRVTSPVWWVEVRAASNPEHAADLAHRFAAALRERLGGVVWPTRPPSSAPAPAPGGPQDGEVPDDRP